MASFIIQRGLQVKCDYFMSERLSPHLTPRVMESFLILNASRACIKLLCATSVIPRFALDFQNKNTAVRNEVQRCPFAPLDV